MDKEKINWAILTALILGFNQFYDQIAEAVAKYYKNPIAFYVSVAVIFGFIFYSYLMKKITASITNACDYAKHIIALLEGIFNALTQLVKILDRRKEDIQTEQSRRATDANNSK